MLMETLDIFVGLITVYLILSLIVTSIGEVVSEKINLKGKVMLRIAENMLGNPKQAVQFFEHDVMRSLRPAAKYRLGFSKTRPWLLRKSTRYPSYVSNEDFVNAFMDYCFGTGTHATKIPTVIEKKAQQINADDFPCKHHLLQLWQAADYDIAVFKQKITDWYVAVGDRSRGWYKRALRGWLLVIGLAVAAMLNVDTLRMFEILSERDDLRLAFAERGTKLIDQVSTGESQEGETYIKAVCKELGVENRENDGTCSSEDILKYGLPEILPLVGWDSDKLPEFKAAEDIPLWRVWALAKNNTDAFGYWLEKFSGLLLTAFALSLGAPFWFDVLQKIVKIRTSLKSGGDSRPDTGAEKAQAEQTPGAKTVIKKLKHDGESPDTGNLSSFRSDQFGYSLINQLWSARFSQLAYADEIQILAELEEWQAQGFFDEYIDKDKNIDAQCIVAKTAKACFLSFRGTEKNLSDWLTDARIAQQPRPWNTEAGDIQVHSGFSDSVEGIWGEIEAKFIALELDKANVPIWISGHSLGGAMAVLAAERIVTHKASALNNLVIGGLHTFGQPRVGNKAFADHLDKVLAGKYIRSVNNRDIVPLVPFPDTPDAVKLIKDKTLKKWRYQHSGRVLYFNDVAKAIMDPPIWYRTLDKSIITKQDELKEKLSETVGDHSIGHYITLHRELLGITNSVTT